MVTPSKKRRKEKRAPLQKQKIRVCIKEGCSYISLQSLLDLCQDAGIHPDSAYVETNYDYDSSPRIALYGEREETDEEVQVRLNLEKLKAEQIEKYEREDLERLKKKYEGK